MLMLRALVLSVIMLSCYGKNITVILNKAFDYVVQKALETVNTTNIDQVKISDLNYSFSERILFFDVNGELVANGGWLKSLSTLNRTGDVTFRKANKTAAIEAHLGLATLEAGYKNYSAKIIGFAINGSIHTKVRRNSIALRVKVYYKKPSCSVDVAVDFEQFDDIHVNATGLSNFNWVLNIILKAVLYRFDEKIKENIEHKLLGLLKGPIEYLDICQAFLNTTIN